MGKCSVGEKPDGINKDEGDVSFYLNERWKKNSRGGGGLLLWSLGRGLVF